MCNVCCKEFQGWCRAFTATEVILSVVQAVLLTLFIAFLTFLILHLIACSNEDNLVEPDAFTSGTTLPDWITTHKPIYVPKKPKEANLSRENDTILSTVPPDIACTWTPSAKTEIVTQYYEHIPLKTNDDSPKVSEIALQYDEFLQVEDHDDGIFGSDGFEGEPAADEKRFIMALVKLKPPDDVTFGCILTIISEFWTLTAASCVECIEEVDSLDSFVIMEKFGEPQHGRTHLATDVLIHPEYQGTNKTYDLAALKSETKLSKGDGIQLPTMLDYLLLAIGERLTILGFGKFRSIELNAVDRGARVVDVHVLPSSQCVREEEAWSARHLAGGAVATRRRCGAASVCAGPLHARGSPCNYCAGTPLLGARTLLGLMSGPGPCGAPCEPTLYVNLAVSRSWLKSVLVQ